jgi:peroxiredoxin
VAYEDRIIAFAEQYASKSDPKVALVAINVNTGKDDALSAMKERARKKNFNFAYLYDPSQEIARRYGAMFTPEFFILDKDRKVVYSGAMDNRAPPGEPTAIYLAPAVESALAGKKPTMPETSAAAGCKIKFNRKDDDQ